MSYTTHSLPYDMEFTQPQYSDFNHYPSDRVADSAAEGRTVLYPSQLHPHPLFTRQENAGPSIQNHSLEPHILSQNHSVYHPPSPYTTQQNWPPYDHPATQSYPQNYPYAPYPSPSPFPAPRLSPPPIHHTPIHLKSAQSNPPASSQNQRLTLAGSLDPSTGIFYRTPEHPRLRTAQACEKCRTRKAKCSGEHPACKRCLTRGLVCEYAKEGRVRGPNKAKSKPSNSGNDSPTNIASSQGQADSRQFHGEQHIHLQKNLTGIQPHSQGQSTPSPPQKRVHQGMPHAQTDHLISLGVPYCASPLQSPSITGEFTYPPSYLQQHHPFPQYPVGNTSCNAISATTGGSSPHTSASSGTSMINSPLTPASASPFMISPSASRSGMNDMTSVDPSLRGPRSGLGGSATIPIDPVWVDHLGLVTTYPRMNSNSEHSVQGIDERERNGFLDGSKHQSTRNGLLQEGNLFAKIDQGHTDPQQDHFHC